MKQDFLKELEFLGVTARIKRLSDALFYSIKELYKIENIDLEPSWHLLLLILKRERKMSMVDLASALHLSKPALTKMANKMAHKGYLNINPDAVDGRRKVVSLSKKALSMLPKFERIWEAGQKAIQEMLTDNPAFMSALAAFEKQHAEAPFSQRALKQLEE